MTDFAPILSIEGLALSAQVRGRSVEPVVDANLTVNAGEIVGLVGESGSGKTLTALAVAALLPENVRVTNGKVSVSGHDILSMNESELTEMRGAGVGMIFQDSLASLNPTMPIGKQVAEVIQLHNQLTKQRAYELAIDTLGSVGLPQPKTRFDSFPHQLSGGMRQRVAIAMAIACEPHLVIADEPTTALDVTVQAQILELLRHLVGERGMGILLITHDLGVIANVADRAAVMFGGRTVESTSVTDIFQNARHPYSQALVDSAPTLSGPVVSSGGIKGSPPHHSQPERGCPFAPRCDYVRSDCLDSAPELIELTFGHEVACFHPLALVLHG